MSSLYECLTPLSSVHLETNDSDEIWDISSCIGYEKHTDSIMPTDKAQELMVRKLKGLSKNSNKAQIAALNSEFQERLKKILSNFTQNKETFTEIYKKQNNFLIKTPKKGENSKNDGSEVREKLSKMHTIKLTQLKKSFEDQKNKVIDLKRDDLQKIWRSKMFELNGKLQQAEWKKASMQREEKEKIKSLYQRVYEQALKNEEILLELDIEEHYKGQFQEKLKKVKSNSQSVRVKIGLELEERFKKEQETWVLSGNVIERLSKKIEEENLQILNKVRVDTGNKYKSEIDSVYHQKKIEIEKSLLSIKPKPFLPLKLSESTMVEWENEVKNELKIENLQLSITQYKNSLIPILTKDIKRTLSLTTDSLVFRNEQEKIFNEVSQELSLTFEFFKRETENLYKKEQQEIQSLFISNLKDTIDLKAKSKILFKERELQIKFIKKLENLKNDLKKEIEEKFILNFKKNKDQLIRDKSLLAQYKAKNNIHVSKLEEEIFYNTQKLEYLLTKLDLKVKEISQKTKNDDELIFKSEDIIGKSSSIHPTQSSTLIPPDHLKDLNSYFLPPSFSAKEMRPKNDSALKSVRIDPALPAAKLKNPENHIHSKSLLRENSTSKSLSFDCLKFKQKEKGKNNLIKQNVYHELLKEKFGFIKPRLK